MTRDELLRYPDNTPVRLADGALGLLIRYWQTSAGIQVPGEENIREIPLERLADAGGGALIERSIEMTDLYQQYISDLQDSVLRLTAERDRLRAALRDLVVFGSAAIDLDLDQWAADNATVALEATIKQARTLLAE